MRIALCNEVVRDLSFERQCEFAAARGYDALEIAPFTLGDAPHVLSGAARHRLRRSAEAAGIAISGLHMLMQVPPGLSITADDDALARRTREVGVALVGLCADLGGRYLVHGSAQQRELRHADDDAGRERALSYFRAMAEAAEASGVVYCLEALTPDRTNFVTSVAEAVDIVRAIGAPAFQTMVDCSHAARGESESVGALLRRWLPTGHIRHIHFNDPNGRGPGEGAVDYSDILEAIADTGYDRDIGIEPFVYLPDGETCAAAAIAYVRRLMADRRAAPAIVRTSL